MSFKKKNIILFADGTGNKGGYTPSSNVYKLYQSIDIHNEDQKQIIFYDNGVGTSTNKYARAIQGAVGVGFKTNVTDLYEFLARNYSVSEDGTEADDIYIFGFSRGAATIRAFNGLLHHSGLVYGRGKGNSDLKRYVKQAMNYYQNPSKKNKAILDKLPMHPMPKVKFIGAWDTVSALGLPERTDKVGISLRVIGGVLTVLNYAFDKIIPFKFYNYEITPNVEKACQAIALDDERTIFWPKVWNEKAKDAENTKINQVWFAGMHSNIGGGYERQELANVSYTWMLEQADGLVLKERVREEAKADSDVSGRMYNSRLGAASFYSYHPRFVVRLSRTAKIKDDEIKIHSSAIERMKLRSANYAPKLLPKKFKVVDESGNVTDSPKVHSEQWDMFHSKIRKRINRQKELYGVFLTSIIAIITCIIVWRNEVPWHFTFGAKMDGILGDIVLGLQYITPDIMDGFNYKMVIDLPYLGLSFVVGVIAFIIVRLIYAKQTKNWAERLRKLYITAPDGHPDYTTKEGETK